jgi:hypothetical protein
MQWEKGAMRARKKYFFAMGKVFQKIRIGL